MWASFAINRPLTWASLAALLACIWLPNPGLRLVAVGIAAFGIIDAWRQVQRDRQHAELMQQALMLSEEGVQITDAENRILAVNPAFTRITGFTEDEVRGSMPLAWRRLGMIPPSSSASGRPWRARGAGRARSGTGASRAMNFPSGCGSRR